MRYKGSTTSACVVFMLVLACIHTTASAITFSLQPADAVISVGDPLVVYIQYPWPGKEFKPRYVYIADQTAVKGRVGLQDPESGTIAYADPPGTAPARLDFSRVALFTSVDGPPKLNAAALLVEKPGKTKKPAMHELGKHTTRVSSTGRQTTA